MILKDESGKLLKKGQIIHMPLSGMGVLKVLDVHEGLVEGGLPPHITVSMTIGIRPVDKEGTCPVYIVKKHDHDKLITEATQ